VRREREVGRAWPQGLERFGAEFVCQRWKLRAKIIEPQISLVQVRSLYG
jgi:hypothetical protein